MSHLHVRSSLPHNRQCNGALCTVVFRSELGLPTLEVVNSVDSRSKSNLSAMIILSLKNVRFVITFEGVCIVFH